MISPEEGPTEPKDLISPEEGPTEPKDLKLICELLDDKEIDFSHYLFMLNSSKCGALVSFLGTTRDYFITQSHTIPKDNAQSHTIPKDNGPQTSLDDGPQTTSTTASESSETGNENHCGHSSGHWIERKVEHLYFEAYNEMALKVMKEVANEACLKYPQLKGLAIIHRLGKVKPKEASILVITASPHRKEAIYAMDWVMDMVKTKVPIFKKEVYIDGNGQWKENAESLCCSAQHRQ